MAYELSIPILVSAALLDSINPCVIGVLVFLLAFMLRFKNPAQMLFISGIYTITVYLAYFLLGLGILQAISIFELTTGFYIITALIAGIAGIIEIKDYFWYGKGFSLAIFPAAAERLKYYTNKFAATIEKPSLLSFTMAAFLGLFVVLIELPCTGAPYLAILGMMSAGFYGKAIPLLLLYNLVFIIPLITIICLAYGGMKLSKIKKWKEEHKRLMRLCMGNFLLLLAAYMIYVIWPLLFG